MGWKDWVYGDLVSAAEFQSLVQDQTVQRYADSAARTSALGSAVAEGMVSYLDSTNQVEVYDGSSWAAVSSSGSGNAIINGAFDIWQRGTSISTTGGYTSDRWRLENDKAGSVTQQTFTPGTAPVSGYEGQYFARIALGAGGSYGTFFQRIEDVRTFAGQNVTLSFWAKTVSGSGLPGVIRLEQNFGTGGSSTVTINGSAVSLTSSWVRYTQTFTVPSISGKTIGSNSNLMVVFPSGYPDATAQSYDIWGVQLEAGSSATAFKRNAPSIQGELAACQRYYYRQTAQQVYNVFGNGYAPSTTEASFSIKTPVTMRTTPTSLDFGTVAAYDGTTIRAISSMAFGNSLSGLDTFTIVASSLSGQTQYRPQTLIANNSLSGYVGVSAEL